VYGSTLSTLYWLGDLPDMGDQKQKQKGKLTQAGELLKRILDEKARPFEPGEAAKWLDIPPGQVKQAVLLLNKALWGLFAAGTYPPDKAAIKYSHKGKTYVVGYRVLDRPDTTRQDHEEIEDMFAASDRDARGKQGPDDEQADSDAP
jgi:hypothetical protein